jgi:tRNA 2-selenouridine synthase SelU
MLRLVLCGLTFDMRGGRKQAKLACGCPLDGRVRRLVDEYAIAAGAQRVDAWVQDTTS